ncbi:hypothetical protein [Pontibacter sp. G13]|uniref:hypothetical protein n=1 Tax=Pontibacter sp. G13 TaxID=3074898 RepID=UPI00288B1425|nr:hypothetical protein [Pontibacter sp. G13]WNJ16656.1 hypothetical protein RJD25_17460 [Pontibacter sp. G13]
MNRFLWMFLACLCAFSTSIQLDLPAQGHDATSQWVEVPLFLPEAEFTQMLVYDQDGDLIEMPIDGYKSAGKQTIQLETVWMEPGVYVYELTQGDSHTWHKALIIP